MKNLILPLATISILFIGLHSFAQCDSIAISDSSFENSTLTSSGNFDADLWYTDDGCELSGMYSFDGDSSACSIGGGAFQFVSVEPNTDYTLSSYVFNGSNDPLIAFKVNWISYPISVTTDDWEQATLNFTTGADSLIIVGFYSDYSCFDDFQLNCSELVSMNEFHKSYPPYSLESSVTTNHFIIDVNNPCIIEVIDPLGRVIEQHHVQNGRFNFGHQLKPTMYILRIVSEGKPWTIKIIKK